MKKLMIAVAGAMAFGLSAVAADWFNGGITADWPNAAGMNGSWTNTEAAVLVAGPALDVDAEEDAPLMFVATDAKKFPGNAKSLTFTTKLEFVPFDELPAVPKDAKLGTALVKQAENAYEYYVLAKDPAAETNAWLATGFVRETAEKEEALQITVATKGDCNVTYAFGTDSTNVCAVLGTGEFSSVGFSGCGEVSSLSATSEAGATIFTIANVANATIESVTGATLVEGNTYSAEDGATVTVVYRAVAGYFFAGGEKTATVEAQASSGITITTETERVLAAAKIDNADFYTLAAAFDASADNDTIVLWSSTTSTVTLVSTKANVTLDLNGHKYTYTPGSYLMSVTNGTLTIKDTSAKADGELIKTGAASVVEAKNGADLVLESGTIHFSGTNSSANEGTVVNVRAGSTFTMNGGSIKLDSTYKQVALRSADTVTVNAGFVGGGFEIRDTGTITLNGGTYAVDPTAYLAVGKAADEAAGVWTVRAAIAATGVALDKTDVTNKVGTAVQLTATVAPANADVKSIVWTSSAEGVAVVTNGEVTAVSVGEATITATLTDRFGTQFAATCKVTVEAEQGGSEVVPGESVNVKTEEEAAKVEVALDDNQKNLTDAQKTAYKGLFDRVVTPGTAGGYDVSFVLSAQATSELAQAVVAAEQTILATPGAASTPTIATKPGLYYSVATGTDVTQKLTEGVRTMATGTEMQLTVPAVGTTQGFYQILVNVTSGIVQ